MIYERMKNTFIIYKVLTDQLTTGIQYHKPWRAYINDSESGAILHDNSYQKPRECIIVKPKLQHT